MCIRDSFKRIIITNEDYLRNLFIYLHLNPENHNMVEDFRNYKYSSYPMFITRESQLIDEKIALSLFGSVDNFIAVHEAKRKTGLELNINFD